LLLSNLLFKKKKKKKKKKVSEFPNNKPKIRIKYKKHIQIIENGPKKKKITWSSVSRSEPQNAITKALGTQDDRKEQES